VHIEHHPGFRRYVEKDECSNNIVTFSVDKMHRVFMMYHCKADFVDCARYEVRFILDTNAIRQYYVNFGYKSE
jgi:mannosyltransferase OCH1-like enzyme